MTTTTEDDLLTSQDVCKAAKIPYRVLHNAVMIGAVPKPNRVRGTTPTTDEGSGTMWRWTAAEAAYIKDAAVIHRVFDIPFPNACRLLTRLVKVGQLGLLQTLVNRLAEAESIA